MCTVNNARVEEGVAERHGWHRITHAVAVHYGPEGIKNLRFNGAPVLLLGLPIIVRRDHSRCDATCQGGLFHSWTTAARSM